MHDDDVFDADPELAGQVDARLDRERHPRLQNLGVAFDDVGVFVTVQADAVTGAVDEVLAVSSVGDHLASGCDPLTRRLRRDRPQQRRPSALRARVSWTSRYFAVGSPTWNIRVVSEPYPPTVPAEIDNDRVALAHDSIPGLVVGRRTVGARGNDGETGHMVPLASSMAPTTRDTCASVLPAKLCSASSPATRSAEHRPGAATRSPLVP